MKNISCLLIKLGLCERVIIFDKKYFLLSENYNLSNLNKTEQEKMLNDDIKELSIKIDLGITDLGKQYFGVRTYKIVEILSEKEVQLIIRENNFKSLGL